MSLADLPNLSPLDMNNEDRGGGMGGSGRREEGGDEGDFLGTQTGTSMDLSHALEGR